MGWVGLCVAPPHHRFLYSVYSVIFAASHLHHLHTAPWQGRHKFVTMPPPIFCTPVLRDFCCFSSPPPPHGPVAVTSHFVSMAPPIFCTPLLRDFRCFSSPLPQGPTWTELYELGMAAHAWGWPLTPGDGRPHVGMATHTWRWQVYVWGCPKHGRKKNKAGVFACNCPLLLFPSSIFSETRRAETSKWSPGSRTCKTSITLDCV